MKKLLAGLFLITAAAAGIAHAEGPEPMLPSDTRIKMLTYDESDIYTITAKYGYQTNIVFGKGEEIQTLSLGDRSLWQLIPSGNRLFIRPMEYGMQTNMTLLTNKHSYQFDIKSVADEKSGGNIYVARFVYPDDEAKRPGRTSPMQQQFVLAPPASSRPAMPAQQQFAAPQPAISHYTAPAQPQPVFAPSEPREPGTSLAASPNYNYTYAGPDAAAPVQAYDNGKSTFIQYRENQLLPSVYVIDANGSAKAVSYNVENNLMVINMVAGEWRLEENNGIVHLYNEMLNSK